MSDLWSRFAALLPAQTLLVGQASAVYDDGSAALDVPNGTVRVLTGGVAVSIGTRYYYRAGRIEGEAPAHPVVNVTID